MQAAEAGGDGKMIKWAEDVLTQAKKAKRLRLQKQPVPSRVVKMFITHLAFFLWRANNHLDG
jgi:hypothetical protein